MNAQTAGAMRSCNEFLRRAARIAVILPTTGEEGAIRMRLMVISAPFALAACATTPAVPVPTPPVRVIAGESPIASSVLVPPGSQLLYVSGTVPDAVNPQAPQGSVARYGDTEAQTRSVLGKVERALAQQGMGLADVVMMRVFLVRPSGAKQMDFAGMMRAYRERFGTREQPNRPARSTMEVAGLVDPGWLVEIEVTAAVPGLVGQPRIITTGARRQGE
jgi:enamine deaminase RidA (YjgF/YER057c/UK114 family)